MPAPPTPLDPAIFPELTAGAAPLLIIAPHGGDLAPASLPDRACTGCSTLNDANTQDLARQVADSFASRTGRRPWLVINRLHRRKFDGNREMTEATGGYAPLDTLWRAWQVVLDSGRAGAMRGSGRAFVVDLHGHAHDIARLELGYLLSAATLRSGDTGVGAAAPQSSIARLAAERAAAVSATSLLRGAPSLGALLVAAGYPSVPSPSDPAPAAGDEYFNGGYNTDRLGSAHGGSSDAVQIECHYAGVRDTPQNRGIFAAALAAALEKYLRDQYGWRP